MKTWLFLLLSSLSGVLTYSQDNQDISTIEFIYSNGYLNTDIKVYQDGKLKTDVTSSDTIFSIGKFSYGHDFRVVFKRKKHVTKIVEIYTKGIQSVMEKKTEIDMSPDLEPKNLFRSQKPFKVPVAKVRIDESGYLNYDIEYIKSRKEAINKYRKKRR